MDYWLECVSDAINEVGIEATDEQIKRVADSVKIAHDQYGMTFGHDAIPNPDQLEINRLKRELKAEQDKVLCKTCQGKGVIVDHYGTRVSSSQCWKCRGEGRHS